MELLVIFLIVSILINAAYIQREIGARKKTPRPRTVNKRQAQDAEHRLWLESYASALRQAKGT